ncbi:sensor domain-containing diguanylate cyclase [Shewanella litoralis]|uniref:diguanylate cyclase n=1 Tax=Shewanella litoralis TaxID=2282700 RepID=A0ABQ2RHK4_9GAMM|nr:GGDEF domain-containing protein [Shewanella litoralis]GGQ27003.1 diguanylate cyclase [Shewanella litoralis]
MSIDNIGLLVMVLLGFIALLILVNLTVFRKAQTKKQQLNSYEQILDQVGAYIYVKDVNCRYVYGNQLILDYFGISQEQLKGTIDSHYFSPHVADILLRNDRKVLSLQQKMADDIMIDNDGFNTVFHEIKQPLFDRNGQLIGLIGISTDITEEFTLRTELQQLANNDPLTDLYNRRSFNAFSEHEFSRAMRYFNSLSLMIIDIDLFKNVNDTYGHLVGDEVIKRVAAVCDEHIREADILARIGGEEFAILLPDTDIDSAFKLAERLRVAQQTSKHASATINEALPGITISIGVASIQVKDRSFADMFARADKALYSSKHIGRNSVNVA